MIISRKKYEQDIWEAVDKAVWEQQSRHVETIRFNDMDRRISELNMRIDQLEQHCFPEKFQKTCRCKA